MISTPWRRLRPVLLAATAAIALAACDTAEERAEKHFQSALELIEKGDAPRARVELQNVFKLNPQHREARIALAELQLEAGKLRDAYSHYLRLVEQFPNDVNGLFALTDLSIRLNSYETAEPYARRLAELVPDDPKLQATLNTIDYRNSILDNDADARREAVRKAQALLPEIPDNTMNRAVIVDGLMLDGEFNAALDELDELQALAPDDLGFHRMRLGIMIRLEDDEGVGDTLRAMVAQFPENMEIAQNLTTHYIRNQDLDGAEAFLRSRYTEGVPDDEARASLIRFLSDTRTAEAAIEQAGRFVEEGTNDQLFRSMRAARRFDNGEVDAAIAELKDIIDTAEAGADVHGVKVTLAEILSRTGNDVGARAMIEEVLAEDQSNVDALRIKALWLITDDQTDEAIGLLRRALDQDPQNANVLTTMAEAHLRNGERELAGEMLSLAVTASERAVKESLDYSGFLLGEKRYAAAEAVVLDALRLQPNSLELYTELTRIFLSTEDWPRLEQLENSLRASDTPETLALADRIRVSMLKAQQRDEDAIAFLEELSDRDGGNRSAEITIVRSHLERNDPQAALNYLDQLRAEAPDDRNLDFMTAAVLASIGDLDGAEAIYREMIDTGEAADRVYLELVRVLSARGDEEEALALVDQALEKHPNSPDLLWMSAGFAERQQDYEQAIAIYEQLYERNTTTSVIANNLASLLSTYRTDQESLDRAWRIARRLRDTEFAPFQDTYGWIAFRKGDIDQALEHLEPAAAALPQDPLVHYHLGMTYLAHEEWEKAKESLERSLEIAGDDPRPAFDDARSGLNTAVSTLTAFENRGNDAPEQSE